MLILIPMNSKNVQEAEITTILEVKVWVQLKIEDGKLVEVLQNSTFDGFDNFSEAIVVKNDGEPVMDFINMSMIILVAHTQTNIDDIVEAYLFRELHDLAY